MNILFYLGHPAQFHFSKNIISRLQKDGHTVLVLIKTKDVLEDLVKKSGFSYVNIQNEVRKNSRYSIAIASLKRTFSVLKLAIKCKCDVLIGTDASIAQVGYILGRPSFTTLEDDFEIIPKLAKVTYPFSRKIIVPKVCKVGKWEKKKVGYDGYMKLAYLHPNYFKKDACVIKKYGLCDRYVLVRLAKLTAHHDVGIKGLNVDLVLKLINLIKSFGCGVYLSSEDNIDERLGDFVLKIDSVDMHQILAHSAMLISDSQSMSVESAMLGVPSLRFSDFSGKISVLEELEHKYELTRGIKTSEPHELILRVKEYFTQEDSADLFNERHLKMLNDKIDVTAFFVWFIENYPESAKIMKENPDYQYNFR